MSSGSPLFDRATSVAGRTYPTLSKDIADYPERLTAAEADIDSLEAGRRFYVHVATLSSKGSDAAVGRMPGGLSGTLLKVKTILNGALATGDATVTAAIDGTNVTGGVVTATQSASAAGDIATATPTALNTFTADSKLTFTVGGTSSATATLEVYALIKY